MFASSQSLTRFAWLSIAAAFATITLKSLAYWLTGSVGLLSDALESVVNLVAAIGALFALIVAARKPERPSRWAGIIPSASSRSHSHDQERCRSIPGMRRLALAPAGGE